MPVKKANNTVRLGRMKKFRKWMKRQSAAVLLLESDPEVIADFEKLGADWDCVLLIAYSMGEARTIFFSNSWRVKAIVIGNVGCMPGHVKLLHLSRKERKKLFPQDREAFKFLRTVRQLKKVCRIAATRDAALDDALYAASIVSDLAGTPLLVAQKGLGLKL